MPFLQRLHELIRNCQFTAFWKELNGSSEAAQSGFLSASSPLDLSSHPSTFLSCASRPFVLTLVVSLHRLLPLVLLSFSRLRPARAPALTTVVKSTYVPQQSHLIPSFRNLFAASIASCFSRISIKNLSNWLDLSSNEVSAWANEVQWSVDGEYVTVPKNGDNDVKAGVVKESVELSRELSSVSPSTPADGRTDKARRGCGVLDGIDHALYISEIAGRSYSTRQMSKSHWYTYR